MKTHVITTALVFALLFVVRVARIFVEGVHAAQNSFFMTTTIIALILLLWAMRVLLVLTRKSPDHGVRLMSHLRAVTGNQDGTV